MPMKSVYRVLLILLSVATGGLFLYSAYTKIVPIEAFEYTIAEYVHLPLMIAAIAARFFIGLEAGLGALLVLHLFGKSKWPLKAAFILLVIFTFYLVWLWITVGNDVNCGCFGDTIWMRPSISIVKNIVLLIAIGLLTRYHKGFTYKWARITAPLILLCAFALSYILFPVFTRHKIDLTPLYTSNKNFAPAIDLAQGKHIIAFLSPSCTHCRKAALKMHAMKEKNPAIPFFMIIGGTTSDLTDFWKASQAQNIPYTRLAQEPFLKYTHGIFPLIIWVNNSWVEAEVDYPDLNQAVIEKWMK